MAYFIRKIEYRKGTCLQLNKTYRVPGKKFPVNEVVENLGYIEDLKKKLNVDDPYAYYKEIARERTEKESAKPVNKITEKSPIRNLGYFLPMSVLNSLDIRNGIHLMGLTSDFRFNLDDVLLELVIARLVAPCSKNRTYHEIIDSTLMEKNYSLDQLYSALEFIGSNYHRYVEILVSSYKKIKYVPDMKFTLFDGSNFYFEINIEDELRRKGPSKENRKSPIVGYGLLLDSNAMPLDMEVYPGNMSEKKVMRDVIADMKARHELGGRIVIVADKGLNCGDNIYNALKDGDGYIFSSSLLGGKSEKEKAADKNNKKKTKSYYREFALLRNEECPYRDVYDSEKKLLFSYKAAIFDGNQYERNNGDKKEGFTVEKEMRIITFNPSLRSKKLIELEQLESKARYLILSKAKRKQFNTVADFVIFEPVNKKTGEVNEDDVVHASINEEKLRIHKEMAGYNMLVTSEINEDPLKIINTYHGLWQIEETFRIMKTDLRARPIYLQKKETIYAHFVICFYAVAILRLLQFHLLESEDGRIRTNDILKFIREYQGIVNEDGVIQNLSARTPFLESLMKTTKLSELDNYYITKKKWKKITDLNWSTLQKQGNSES